MLYGHALVFLSLYKAALAMADQDEQKEVNNIVNHKLQFACCADHKTRCDDAV